ncbi:pantoate--beta-alanine ligase [Paenibacillus sp.]|uniref:pantoate--beta-alanine ligase n=1 Tax=Paenibacillus sp. TaxID=58172 RepID=UPI002D388852|nr:pantoate--beta-alanine ligase [Paenibacillus sp.]HZG55092.1 pantoate--beta-alanine ligase [Paenibacillus sp.]
MKTFRTIEAYHAFLREVRKTPTRTIGFVPTMGYLHAGHLSLVERAKRENDVVAMSVFVNPLQFGPNEDFDRYPRNEARDLELMEAAGVDAAFLPTVEEMYPRGTGKTTVSVAGVTERLCGAFRPGHFDGVATVVAKLFHIIRPDRAYFGLKDAQQVAVIATMAADLNFPIEIVPCPTLRESDGLAMSSRNVYLTAEQRARAPVLYRSLQRIDEWLASEPGLTSSELEARLADAIRETPGATLDYAQVLAYPTLEPFDGPAAARDGRWIAALAVKFGHTRLIDNRLFP